MTRTKPERPAGFRHWPGYLDGARQAALLAEVLSRAADAPFYTPTLPRSGRAMRVRMTNLGPLGWVTDKAGGYRYQVHHPVTGAPWPDIPEALIEIWEGLGGYRAPPEACLVNYYGRDSRLGLHVDADEAAQDAPVLSVSLGDPALFRIGGPGRRDPTGSVWLESGDVMALTGPARHCHHGVDRIRFGECGLIAGGGRINLTLRRVSLPVGAC